MPTSGTRFDRAPKTALALAMANVVSGERGANPGLRSSLAAFTPEMAAEGNRNSRCHHSAPGPGIRRAASEPGGRRRESGPSTAGAVELCAAVNLLNYVAGKVGETVRFGADSTAATATPRSSRCWPRSMRVRWRSRLVHDANPAYTLPKASGFAATIPEGRLSRSPPRCTWMRPLRSAI